MVQNIYLSKKLKKDTKILSPHAFDLKMKRRNVQ